MEFNEKGLKKLDKEIRRLDLKIALHELYLECEHGDEEHRKWLKDKFDDFLNRKLKDDE